MPLERGLLSQGKLTMSAAKTSAAKTPWSLWLKAALQRGLSPEGFWNMTPFEMSLFLGVSLDGQGNRQAIQDPFLKGQELKELMTQWPDENLHKR